MAVYPGKVTLTVAAIVVDNLKRIRWRRAHRVTPQTVMNTKLPIGWHQGHKWVEGEVHVLSEADLAFGPHMNEEGDNTIITTFVATITDSDGNTKTATFTGAIIVDVEEPYADGEDSVHVYRFMAYKVVKS